MAAMAVTVGGFIFDFDGVLVDSNAVHVEAWRRALAACGFEVAPERIFVEIGKGGDKVIAALLGEEAEERCGDRARAVHAEEFTRRALEQGLRVIEGGPELIAELRRRGVATALATSSPLDQLEVAERASRVRWREKFDFLVTASDVEQTKPDPDLVQAALSKLRLPAARCLMIGDTPWDAHAAGRAGVSLIGVTSGGNRSETLLAAGARAVYRDAADVLAHLDAVLSGAGAVPDGGAG
jgi:HAD superfamily hydrolase (TIGR01509 family)